MSLFGRGNDQPEEIDLTTAGVVGSESIATEDAVPEVPDENSRYLRMHVAEIYDAYSNFKDKMTLKFKERVMRFMRHELRNNDVRGSSGPRDVEGGADNRASNITYDSLIFKVTVILGFVLQFPVMWVAGSALFLATSNFKASTVKWGSLNVALSTLSIMYMLQQWQIRSARFLYNPSFEKSIIFESSRATPAWESYIIEGNRRLLMREFTSKDGLLWKPPLEYLPPGDYEAAPLGKDGILIDPDNIKGYSSVYCANGAEIGLSGWIQFGATFTNSVATKRDTFPMRIGVPGKLPVTYRANETPIFDVGMRCVATNKKIVWIGINASRTNSKSIQSDAFYIHGPHNCSLAYTTTGSRPVVHSVYIKAL
ncbi:uncharacterized protein BXIN_0826 [Babesia sp. Xinjiang]|uniref:uncharacterized protein n=1 Tax=Babesia sp. Xinjiang TaxID=462227 RepID=UPI000A259EDB|nr:uncharacterized protein BXIN_0826 [Babesia sp. Xinjiang]ORM41281.1 hypothetical protein BXIN_0826 [Babesia sp. Xinjiang]